YYSKAQPAIRRPLRRANHSYYEPSPTYVCFTSSMPASSMPDKLCPRLALDSTSLAHFSIKKKKEKSPLSLPRPTLNADVTDVHERVLL
uniref:Uncharacterized protein n=1 Tax=Mesocestoides corti TaxID=53468 RepID=A0A5K3G1Z0_MESCO